MSGTSKRRILGNTRDFHYWLLTQPGFTLLGQ